MFATLKGLGLGAGLMYFFDPEQGPWRRSLVRDQLAGVVEQLQGYAGQSSHELAGRAQGLLSQAADHAQEFVSEQTRGMDLPVSAVALNPAAWSPAARMAAGAVGAVLGLKLMRRMPLASLALGGVALAWYVQKQQSGAGGSGWDVSRGWGAAGGPVDYEREEFAHYGNAGMGPSGGIGGLAGNTAVPLTDPPVGPLTDAGPTS